MPKRMRFLKINFQFLIAAILCLMAVSKATAQDSQLPEDRPKKLCIARLFKMADADTEDLVENVGVGSVMTRVMQLAPDWDITEKVGYTSVRDCLAQGPQDAIVIFAHSSIIKNKPKRAQLNRMNSDGQYEYYFFTDLMADLQSSNPPQKPMSVLFFTCFAELILTPAQLDYMTRKNLDLKIPVEKDAKKLRNAEFLDPEILRIIAPQWVN